MGCVPTFITPTPIPPLDPNAIGTFMVQTAAAASTQTMAAIPPATSTATFTPTPRNTFTPEPSFTPVQPFLFPSPTLTRNLLYYRVKHDNQLALYKFKSRTYDDNSSEGVSVRKQTPEVVPLFVAPKASAGTGRINMSGAWEAYMSVLNDNNQSKLRYLKSDISGLFNTAGFPQMESLTMGGNIVTLAEIQGGWARVNTMAAGSPPSVAEVNYVTRPDLVHKFVVVGWKKSTRTTILTLPPKGNVYYPFVSQRSLWIPIDRLEPFPILPMEVQANINLNIQPKPGPEIEETKSKLSAGESATVVEYYPSASRVWGRLQSGGWIPLILKGKFTTTWSMATAPPP